MNKCRYISEYHQNIILQHCNSIHFKYTPQTTILFRELPRSPEHLGRPVAVRGWAASWPHNVHFMSLEAWSHAGAGDNFHWLLTEWAAPQLHSSTLALGVQRWHHKPVPRLVTAGCCHWPEMRGPSETSLWRSWTKHKEGSVCMNEGHQRRGPNQGLQEYCITDNGACCQL